MKPGESPRRNDPLRRARLERLSPSGSGAPMSRQELADAVNAYVWATHGVDEYLTGDRVGALERGRVRWPSARVREGLRAVLEASDVQLGMFKTHRQLSAEQPLDDPPAVGVSDGPHTNPPVRVVLHWNGRKAYALRVAMRMSSRDFAAKLGVNPAVVHAWRPASTGRLRYETHQMLDAILARATDDDQQRFDIALTQVGESR